MCSWEQEPRGTCTCRAAQGGGCEDVLQPFLLLSPLLPPRTNTCVSSLSCQFGFLAANKPSLGQLNFQEACQGIAFISIKRNEMGKKGKRLDCLHEPLVLLSSCSVASAPIQLSKCFG